MSYKIDTLRQPQTFTYAFGKHDGGDAEFCWRVPKDLVSCVKPGVRAYVSTSRGLQIATVTRVETSSAYAAHKLVVGIAD